MTNCEECKFRYLSFHDPLTRLYNRAFFDEEMERFGKGNEGSPLSIVIIDIDDLKKVNDKFGHRAGDKHIIDAAEIISGVFKETDIVARIGGDEFCAILPSVSISEARGIKEKIEEVVQKRNLQGGLNMGLSVGIATSFSWDRASDVFQRADEDLYRNKREKDGR